MWGAARPAFSPRRAFLVTLGAGWVGYGYVGIIRNPRYGTARGVDDLARLVPGGLATLGWMWVAAGAVAVLAGAVRGCPRVQAAGYSAVAVPAGLWAGLFATAAATSQPTAAGSAWCWAAFTIGVLIVSGMDDPPPPYLRKARR
ncbi:hypothetical protein [Streptomyces sp. NPDC055210]